MIERNYSKYCDVGRLTSEIIIAGLPISPNTGARFYGCVCNYIGTGWETKVLLYDDITAGEISIVDTVVSAHIPTPLPGSGPVPVEETQIFNNLAIRDTNTATSVSSNNIGYRVKTLIITNTLDQAVTKQCQGSRDNSNWFNIGDSFTVSSGATIYQTCETYFPYVRAQASCSVAPTTGSLNMWIEKMGV
jgi:hypothetical protein